MDSRFVYVHMGSGINTPAKESPVATSGPMPPDQAVTLLEGQPTFEAFYQNSYTPLVRSLVVALGDYDRGLDAADEAMARAYPRWAEISGYDNPAGWCFRVGLNFGRSRLRRLARKPPPSPVGWHVDQLPNPEVWQAVQALNRDLRDVIVCRLVLELSSRETATHLGISEGTVKSRLHRARNQLQNALAPQRAEDEGNNHD